MKRLLFLASLSMLSVVAFAQTVLIPFSGSTTSNACSGTFQDHAGNGNYSNYASGYLIIDPPGTGTVSVTFSQFALESCCDYVRVYDGAGITGTLLGTYNGYSIPNGGNAITSTSGAITIRFTSDYSATYAGFTGTWTASGGSSAPSASFTVSNSNPLFNTGVQFTNTSQNQVVIWDFGDGNTSADDSPIHAYAASGTYAVKQVVSNCNGLTDTSAITNITVQAAPNGAVSVDTVAITVPCGSTNSTSFSISNSGSGSLNYNLNLVPSATGQIFYESFEGTGTGQFTNQNPGYYSSTLKTNGAPQGNQYLELSGDGNSYDGLMATFSSAAPSEISYFVKPESSYTYNGHVAVGQQSSYFSPIFYTMFYYGYMRLYHRTTSGALTYYNYPVSIGTWYHVQIKNVDFVNYTYDIYVNGTLIYQDAQFNNYVNDVNRFHVYSQYQGTVGIDGISMGGADFTSSINYSPSSATVGSSNSTTIFINANASGLNAGTYWMDFVISSNDTSLDGTIIPVELTVTGDAVLNQSATCLNMGSLYTGVTVEDSVMIWNNGCDTLNFTSLSSSSTDLTGTLGLYDIPPYDTTFLKLIYSPGSAGSLADTLFIYGSDTNSYVCINANASNPPQASIDTTLITATINGCADSITVPITLYNPGGASLNYWFNGNGTDTVKVLALSVGYYYSYYNNAVSALSTYMTVPYTVSLQYITSAALLTSALEDYDVLWIPPLTSGYYSTYTALAPAVQSYVSGGGKLVVCGTGYTSNILNLGIFTGSYYSQDYGGYSMEVNSSFANHPIVQGVSNSALTPYKTYYYTVTNSNKKQLVQRTGSSSYSAVTEVDYGSGKAVWLGFDFYQSNNDSELLFANSIEHYGKNSSLPDWVIASPDSGAVVSSDSVTVSFTFFSTGNASGTYNGNIVLNSNDPLNPEITIPVQLTINGTADLVAPANCVVTDSIMESTTSVDSLMLYNQGCEDLVISNMTTQTSNYTVWSTTDTIEPGDTSFVKFSYGGTSSIGYYYDTLSISSNVPLEKVCLSGYAFGAPSVDVDSTQITATLNSCSDSVIIPLTIANPGLSPLDFWFYGSETDTIKVLALSVGYNYSRYYTALSALSSNLTTPYTVSLQYITSASLLTSTLEDYDVLWIPPLTSGYYSTYTALAPAVQGFVNDGGRLIVCGTGYTTNVLNLGIFTGSYYAQDYGNASLSINSSYANHPIVQGLSSSIVTPNKVYYYTITNPGKRQLLERTNSSSYSAVTEIDYGSGKAVWMGYDFYYTNADADKVFANAIEHYGKKSGLPDWITVSPDSGIVAAADSITVNIKLKANGNGSGVYTDTIKISTNDPDIPVVNIPVQLTINGSADIAVQNNCADFDSVFVGVTDLYSSVIYNTGCDTLTIDSTFSGTGYFGLANLPLIIAPEDSQVVDFTFKPDTIGLFQDTIHISSNSFASSVCVEGFGKGAPAVTPGIDTMRVTVNKCDGYVTKQFSFQNSGYGVLDYEITAATLYQGISSQNYTGTYAVTNHTFSNTPSTADTIFFMVVVNGDYNYSSSGEYYTFRVENYAIYSIYDNNVPDGVNDTSYGYYTGPNIATWLADGQLDVSISNGYGVDPNIGTALHHVEVYMKSTPSWMTILSATTGTLNAGSTTTKDVLFNVNNLAVGTYTSSLVIESDDPVNPIYSIPVILNVVDKPTMEIHTTCVNFGQVTGSTPVVDSVMIYNTGCQNLNITSLQFLDPDFSSTMSTATIPSKDSLWLPITLTASSQGNKNTSVIVYSNDTNLSVCLTASVGFKPIADFDFVVTDECDGQVSFSDISSNSPHTWEWNFGDGNNGNVQNPSHTFAKPGTYNVELIVYNLVGTDTIQKTVAMNDVLYVDFSKPDSIFKLQPAQFYDSSIVATSWEWFFGDGVTSTQQNPVHTYAQEGTFFLTFIASNPKCTTTVYRQIKVHGNIGIEEESRFDIKIYPVPSSNFVQVEWNNKASFETGELFGLTGNKLQTFALNEKQLRIDVQSLPNGVYLLKLINPNGDISIQRIIVKR